jgi:hypothetical protein
VKNIVDEEVQRKLREKEFDELKDANKKLQATHRRPGE